MPTYDSNLFNPPAPVASVTLRDRGNGNITSNVRMLIDTGVDITLVPETSVNQLKSDFDSRENYELKGFDGQRSMAQAVHLDLVFLNRTFRERFLIIKEEVGIMGRDVLNQVVVELDGPHLSWKEPRVTSAR